MPSVLKTMVFPAVVFVVVLARTAGFPVGRSRPSYSRKVSTTVDTSSLVSTGTYFDHRYDLVDVRGRLLQQNVNVGRKVEGNPLHPLRGDSIPSETEAIISVQVTKQDIDKSAGFIIEQKDNAIDGNFWEHNTELKGATQVPWSSGLHDVPVEGLIQPEHWLLVKDFIMDDYLFGELDESAREYFLRRILSGLIMSQQTR